MQTHPHHRCHRLKTRIFNADTLEFIIKDLREVGQGQDFTRENSKLVHEFAKHGSCDLWIENDFNNYGWPNENLQGMASLTEDINNCVGQNPIRTGHGHEFNPNTAHFKNIIKHLARYVLVSKSFLDQNRQDIQAQLEAKNCDDSNKQQYTPFNVGQSLFRFFANSKFEANVAADDIARKCVLEYVTKIEVDTIPAPLEQIDRII